MLLTSKTAAAYELARRAHEGQADKAGLPYIDHVRRVAASVLPADEDHVCAALLHDSVEDGDVTLEEVREAAGEVVADAVALLTHDPRTPYLEYVAALKVNPVAAAVKRADLADNSSPSRLAVLDAQTRLRLAEKYRSALEVLG